jgi:hypothetical protein
MSVIIRFINLDSRDKKIIIDSLFWIVCIRLMIWLFPFDLVQKKVCKRVDKYKSNSKRSVNMIRLKILIVATARQVPRATCLVQALAGHILFSKYGYNTSIKIGVLTENGEFEAHAWLEHGEIVVLGESEKNYKTVLGID